MGPYESLVTTVLPEGSHTITVEYRDEVEDPNRFERLFATIVVDFPPPAPAEFRVRGFGTGWVELVWAPTDALDVTDYSLWRRAGASGAWTLAALVPRPAFSWRDTGLDPEITYHYRITAHDIWGNASDVLPEVGLRPLVLPVRHSGSDRFLTAVDVSRDNFPSSTEVVLVSGESFADALSASSLAGALGAPILLTRSGSLPPAVANEILRLGATRVHLIGGYSAVSPAVERTLRQMPLRVERVGGRDRYETAAMIAEETLAIRGTVPLPDKVFVVRGDDFADGLSVSPAAYAGRIPVLLVRPTGVPPSTAAAIRDGGFSRAVVLGGEAAIPESVKLRLGIASERVWGADRYGTAAEFATWALDNSLLRFADTGIATGQVFPDALSGGAAMGERGGVLLLTRSATLAPAAREALAARKGGIERLTVFGGERAVQANVVEQASQALR